MTFGEYVQTHGEHDNTMQPHTIGAIDTRPSNNGRGYYLISLSTGHRIDHRSWTSMPVPLEIVAQVHRLTWQSKAKRTLKFTNTGDEDIDVLYAAIEHNGDGVDLAHANDKLLGVDGEDKDNASNEDYNPEQSND